MTESICPSCGKTDRTLWPEGCNNTWHMERGGAMSLGPVCTCLFTGKDRCEEHGKLFFGGIDLTDYAAALRERDDRIAALEAENARLSAPVTEDEASELAADFHDGYGIRGTEAFLKSRKGAAS